MRWQSYLLLHNNTFFKIMHLAINRYVRAIYTQSVRIVGHVSSLTSLLNVLAMLSYSHWPCKFTWSYSPYWPCKFTWSCPAFCTALTGPVGRTVLSVCTAAAGPVGPASLMYWETNECRSVCVYATVLCAISYLAVGYFSCVSIV